MIKGMMTCFNNPLICFYVMDLLKKIPPHEKPTTMRPFRFLPDNLDETLFEHRNKEYGAYELRKSYHVRVIKSFLFSLSLLLVLFGTPFLIKYFSKKEKPKADNYTTTMVDLSMKYDVDQKKSDPLPIAHASQKNKSNPFFQIISDSLLTMVEVKNDSIQQPVDLTALANNNAGLSISSGGDSNDTTASTVNHEIPGTALTASTVPYGLASVDKVPQFPGGINALTVFLIKNTHYNSIAREAGVTGKVHASFIVNSKGEVEAIKIIRSLGYGLDEEVLRVLSIMPKWEPGLYQGKAVSTILNIPVSFSLIQ